MYSSPVEGLLGAVNNMFILRDNGSVTCVHVCRDVRTCWLWTGVSLWSHDHIPTVHLAVWSGLHMVLRFPDSHIGIIVGLWPIHPQTQS